MKIFLVLVSAVAGLDLAAHCQEAQHGSHLGFITVDPRLGKASCTKGRCLMDKGDVCDGLPVLVKMTAGLYFQADNHDWSSSLLEPFGDKRAYDGVNIHFQNRFNYFHNTPVNEYISLLLSDAKARGKYALTLSYNDFLKVPANIVHEGKITDHLLAVFVELDYPQESLFMDYEAMLNTPGIYVLVKQGGADSLAAELKNLAIPSHFGVLGQFSHDTAVCDHN